MIDHVSIAVGDLGRAAIFYDAVMASIAMPCVWREPAAIGYGLRSGPDDDGNSYLTIRATGISQSASRDNSGQHWCFRAPSRLAVDAFHAAGCANGGSCDGPPGLRLHYHDSYYAAFLIDPDGNRVEVVCHRKL
jgi:catechol 2,3-dioxygenase-like lactoylglutathione lyase family enzyme